jgi:general stress protein YciG
MAQEDFWAMAGRRTPKQNPAQKETVGRVMHEFKHGELETSRGSPVKNPKQAVAIALHEAGASREESPARNRRNLARTKAREHQMEAGRSGGQKSRGGGASRAELYEEAKRRGIPGRSRMGKAELERALKKSR